MMRHLRSPKVWPPMVNEALSADKVAEELAVAKAKRLVVVAFMGKTCSR